MVSDPKRRHDEGSIKGDSSEREALLERARRLAHDRGGHGRGHADDGSSSDIIDTVREINENLSFIKRCIQSSRIVLSGLKANILNPLVAIVGPPCRGLYRYYQAFWNRYAYSVDPSTKQRTLSRTRSTVVVIATMLFVSIFTNTQLGSWVRFVTVEPVVDGILMLVSKRTEVFYLSQSDEVDPQNNIYSVRGCRKLGECAEKDAAYFRVQPRLSHDIWKLLTYGNPVYVPDHIVAPIAPGLNECQVTYYGYRMTSSWIARILRSLQFYPTMLEAKCLYLQSN